MGGDLGGDLVAFQHVLERLDPHAVLLGRAQEHQDLVAAVAVAVDLDRAVEDTRQRLQPQVDARGRAELGRVLRLLGLAVVVPRRSIRPGLLEGPFDHRLDAHPGVGEPSRATA